MQWLQPTTQTKQGVRGELQTNVRQYTDGGAEDI